MAEVMAVMLEAMGGLLEACVGYRAQIVAAGIEPAVADQMACDLHRHLLTKIFGT